MVCVSGSCREEGALNGWAWHACCAAGGRRPWMEACGWRSAPAGWAQEFGTSNTLPEEWKPLKTSRALSHARRRWFCHREAGKTHPHLLPLWEGVCLSLQVWRSPPSQCGNFLVPLWMGFLESQNIQDFQLRDRSGQQQIEALTPSFCLSCFKHLLKCFREPSVFGCCYFLVTFLFVFVCTKVFLKYYMLMEESVEDSAKYKESKKK